MLTACASWMMKISTTMRAAAAAISPVRMPLIRVCSCPRRAPAARAGAAGRSHWLRGGASMMRGSARHGVGRGQVALSAALIRVFGRLGWVSGARWPSPVRLEQDSRPAGDAAAQALARGQVPAPAQEPAASLLAR
jgi:hypothetical protein